MKKLLAISVLAIALHGASEEPEFTPSSSLPTIEKEVSGYKYCRFGTLLVVPVIAGVGYRSNTGHHNYDLSISTMGGRIGYNYYFNSESIVGQSRAYIGPGLRILSPVTVPWPDLQIGWEKKKESSYSFFELGIDIAASLIASAEIDFPSPIFTLCWGFSF